MKRKLHAGLHGETKIKQTSEYEYKILGYDETRENEVRRGKKKIIRQALVREEKIKLTERGKRT